ncbi:uncharacterized protein LOC135391911 isoform X3 [Ornithodoros turicata]|uniref:uncharacterized protein LOC135391911 isoform X3 n=1 Tax=Ornithodoros turicata TaxID=34597 RepID=UPI003139212D
MARARIAPLSPTTPSSLTREPVLRCYEIAIHMEGDRSSRMPYNQMNGRRSHGAQREPQERISPQHEEVVSYLHNSWKHVCNQYEISQQAAYEGKVQRVVYYRQKEPTVSNSCSSQYVGGL